MTEADGHKDDDFDFFAPRIIYYDADAALLELNKAKAAIAGIKDYLHVWPKVWHDIAHHVPALCDHLEASLERIEELENKAIISNQHPSS